MKNEILNSEFHGLDPVIFSSFSLTSFNNQGQKSKF